MWKGAFGNASRGILKEICSHPCMCTATPTPAISGRVLSQAMLSDPTSGDQDPAIQESSSKVFSQGKTSKVYLVLLQAARQINLQALNSSDCSILQSCTAGISEGD